MGTFAILWKKARKVSPAFATEEAAARPSSSKNYENFLHQRAVAVVTFIHIIGKFRVEAKRNSKNRICGRTLLLPKHACPVFTFIFHSAEFESQTINVSFRSFKC